MFFFRNIFHPLNTCQFLNCPVLHSDHNISKVSKFSAEVEHARRSCFSHSDFRLTQVVSVGTPLRPEEFFDKKKKNVKELRKKVSEKEEERKKFKPKGEKGKKKSGMLIEKEILSHVLKLISCRPAPVNAFRVT